MKEPAAFPRLDPGEREAVAEHFRARIVELRDELENLLLDSDRTQQKRGAIAEVRKLLGQMYPDASAPAEPPSRGTIY